MFYLIVDGGEAEAQARAKEGFEVVMLLNLELLKTARASEHASQRKRSGVVDLWWHDHSEARGVRITWDRERNQFMVHRGEWQMWEGCYGLRLHLEQMGFSLWDDMAMADDDTEEADLVQHIEGTRVATMCSDRCTCGSLCA